MHCGILQKEANTYASILLHVCKCIQSCHVSLVQLYIWPSVSLQKNIKITPTTVQLATQRCLRGRSLGTHTVFRTPNIHLHFHIEGLHRRTSGFLFGRHACGWYLQGHIYAYNSVETDPRVFIQLVSVLISGPPPKKKMFGTFLKMRLCMSLRDTCINREREIVEQSKISVLHHAFTFL